MKRLKAYTVHDGGDQSVIRFAASNVVARREGANELNCVFDEVDYCTRSPEFDAYAPGPVTGQLSTPGAATRCPPRRPHDR